MYLSALVAKRNICTWTKTKLHTCVTHRYAISNDVFLHTSYNSNLLHLYIHAKKYANVFRVAIGSLVVSLLTILVILSLAMEKPSMGCLQYYCNIYMPNVVKVWKTTISILVNASSIFAIHCVKYRDIIGIVLVISSSLLFSTDNKTCYTS